MTNEFSKLPLITNQSYERYLPSAFDESMTLLQKLNIIIDSLNNAIERSNEVSDYVTETIEANDVKQTASITQLRNEFVSLRDWVENTGVETRVDEVLNEWLDNGRLVDVIKQDRKTLKNNPSPLDSFFGWTGVADLDVGGAFDPHKVGEPFIVKDGTQYRMFYFGYRNSPQELACLDAVSSSLQGPWVKRNINLTPNGALNRHKMVILVDELGEPVKVNNKYHAYVVGFPYKQIFHWESDNLGFGWVETGLIIDKGFSGNGSDGYGADAPYALWYDNKVLLYYMAMPQTAQADFGLAHRINLATSIDPSQGFNYYGVACLPSTDTSSWYYGWLGGSQVRMASDGTWWIALNAASTRPTVAGKEDYPSLWGMATTNDPYSRWSVYATPKSSLPEQKGLSSLNPQPIDAENVWRPHLQYSQSLDCWIAYYNTGGAIEKITHQLEDKLFFAYSSDDIQKLTTSEVKIIGSETKVTKGYFKINFTANVMSGGSGETPKLDVVIKARYKYGSTIQTVSEIKSFVGSYQYENTNIDMTFPLLVQHDNVSLDFTVQVTGGTPTTTTRIRNMKLFIERI